MQSNIHSRIEKLEAITRNDKHDPWAGLTDAQIIEAMIGVLQKMDGCSYEEASADPAVAAALHAYRAKQKARKPAEALHGAERGAT